MFNICFNLEPIWFVSLHFFSLMEVEYVTSVVPLSDDESSLVSWSSYSGYTVYQRMRKHSVSYS
jgi:hypothetical protein